ncbi:reverse transcriptase domain-containing protein, partial [Salmonella enterica subsp. enterica serovar Paratyphi A]
MVFYEMASWYAEVQHDVGADVKDNVVIENASPSSQVLSGPQGSPSTGTFERPWSGRLNEREILANSSNVSQKGKENVDDAPQVPELSAGYDDVDRHSSGSDHSLDEEFGIPSVKTPGVKKALEGMHEKLRRSERTKKRVQRLKYDGYVARHCAYMAKIVQDVEPTCFEDAVGDVKWEKAMDEEMAALSDNKTWELVPLSKDIKLIGCKWVYKAKHKADGNVECYKARLVAKGYAQTYGIDYE